MAGFVQKTTITEAIGSIKQWGSSTMPSGWLLCDGTAVSRSTYANLFANIGTTYGVGDGSTTFNVPDFRAASPVGAGTSIGYVENETVALGDKDDDRMQDHGHNVYQASGDDFLRYGDGGTVNGYTVPVGANNQGDAPIEARSLVGTLGGAPRVSNTTHGKRIGVNFIIKY